GEAQPKTVVLSQDSQEGNVDLNEHIMFALDGATNISHFYLSDTMALSVKAAGREASFALEGLPRYGERVRPGPEEILDSAGRIVRGERSRPIPLVDNWSLPLPVGADRVEAADWPVR